MPMINAVKRVFTPFTPRERGLYAIHVRERLGEFLLYVGKEDTKHHFINIPDLYPLYFTNKEFKKSLRGGILEFVEVLPQDVFDVALVNSKGVKLPIEQKMLDVPEEKEYDDNEYEKN